MELVLVPAVVGAVEFLRRLQARDWFAAATIAVSGGIGALLGAVQAPGVTNAYVGLVGGLAASGLVTVASRVSTSNSVKG